jgi:hypothetical protein
VRVNGVGRIICLISQLIGKRLLAVIYINDAGLCVRQQKTSHGYRPVWDMSATAVSICVGLAHKLFGKKFALSYA